MKGKRKNDRMCCIQKNLGKVSLPLSFNMVETVCFFLTVKQVLTDNCRKEAKVN